MNGNRYFYAFRIFTDQKNPYEMKMFKRSLFVAVFGLLSLTMFAQGKDVPKGWHLMNPADSGYHGISMDQAYAFVKSKNLKSTPVIVAVIDSGIDTAHEDLRPVLWRNPKEIPGNGIDDDKNGYVDDIYGWNFIGGRDGSNVEKDTYESARIYHRFKNKFSGKDVVPATPEEEREYEMWKRAKKDVANVDPSTAMTLIPIKNAYKKAVEGDSVLRTKLKENYTGKDAEAFVAGDDTTKKARNSVLNIYRGFQIDFEMPVGSLLSDLGEYIESEEAKLRAADEEPIPYRANVVKDNYYDFNDRFYGNNDVMASNHAALHGTHVSGIIGAARNNGKGMDGVADNVRIMTIRAVPDGDEHDKDVALAIRYAVDNGAQVINMSFGKGLSPEKIWVDEAIQYAESKGVLLVHAAGNSAANIDTSWNFPTPIYENGKRASNMITVGASGPGGEAGSYTASFSNYGKDIVDVFAPGVKIYATVPGGDKYQNLQGTSMASPVVAGLAAFILEYYPNLSAKQVKEVIEKSSQKPTDKVKTPGTGVEVELSELSRSGGIVNAYEAIKLASTLKGERKAVPAKKPVKSKVKEKKKA